MRECNSKLSSKCVSVSAENKCVSPHKSKMSRVPSMGGKCVCFFFRPCVCLGVTEICICTATQNHEWREGDPLIVQVHKYRRIKKQDCTQCRLSVQTWNYIRTWEAGWAKIFLWASSQMFRKANAKIKRVSSHWLEHGLVCGVTGRHLGNFQL